jgi:hypothetical protein
MTARAHRRNTRLRPTLTVVAPQRAASGRKGAHTVRTHISQRHWFERDSRHRQPLSSRRAGCGQFLKDNYSLFASSIISPVLMPG